MTLVIGFLCEDGIVMSADSAATDIVQDVKVPVQKIFYIPKFKMLVGGSGDWGFIQELKAAIEGIPRAAQTIPELREYLRNNLRPKLSQAYPELAKAASQGHQVRPVASLLLGGFLKDKPYLARHDFPGNLEDVTEQGFCAIGSGAQVAYVLWSVYAQSPLSINAGQLLATLIVKTAADVTAIGIALPLRMVILEKGKEPQEISPDSIEKHWLPLAQDYRQLLRDSLHQFLSQQVGKLSIPSPPLPE
jgi:20S proteasome alpha/beta subunit